LKSGSERTSVGVQLVAPQRPKTATKASPDPTKVPRRYLGPKSEPNGRDRSAPGGSPRDFTHRSGSFIHTRTATAKSAGTIPTRKRARQLYCRNNRLAPAASRNPAAQAD